MKTKVKILLTALIISVFLVSGISVAAEESEAAGATLSEAVTDVSDERENLFTLIYETALTYASEIFSFLSLIGTLIVGHFYRRGLIPSVKSVLSNMGSTVGNIKESSDKHYERQQAENEKLSLSLSELEMTIASQSEKLSALEQRLISEEDIYKQRERSNLILSAQIDLLYDIFMSSSLPQYQKEATGEKINKMRKEIKSYE